MASNAHVLGRCDRVMCLRSLPSTSRWRLGRRCHGLRLGVFDMSWRIGQAAGIDGRSAWGS
jgi:hypothetical protein